MTAVLAREGASPTPRILLSYCIPIMDRAKDLQATLPHNLDANRSLAGTIEFIVVIFDRDDALLTWLRKEFPAEIESGYLVVKKSTALTEWHFGRAKNAFADILKGQLYSSLDGDNFVSLDESRQILDLYERFGGRFLFHHFSGSWGDGTSGRITLGKELYRSVGYDESFMPRQFDELDLLISVLCTTANIPFITHFDGGFIAKSPMVRRFLKEEGIVVNNVVVHRMNDQAPLNPRNRGYLRKAPLLRLMEEFNRHTCFAKNSASADRKRNYRVQAQECSAQIAALLDDRTASAGKFSLFDALIANVRGGRKAQLRRDANS